MDILLQEETMSDKHYQLTAKYVNDLVPMKTYNMKCMGCGKVEINRIPSFMPVPNVQYSQPIKPSWFKCLMGKHYFFHKVDKAIYCIVEERD